jgi:NAD(P)-dependent dehydrogenase (short-subunit alcohol dehydrogenase family)
MTDLRKKVAVVTGGGRGIGRAILDVFTSHGMRVAFCSRTKDELEKVKRELQSVNPGRIYSAECDVRNPQLVHAFMEAVSARFGRIDIMIHNAGIGRFGKISELSSDDWRDVIDIDLNGSFYVIKDVFGRMLNNPKLPKGYIVTIGSLCHRMPVAGNVAYASAKAAQKVLADYLFEEARKKDVLSTYLAIGSVNTTFGRTRDTGWKIQPREVAEVVMNMTEMAFSAPHLCLSYAELRVRHPMIKRMVGKE